MFFAILWNSTFLLFYYSARKKATSIVFIWGDKGYPADRFEYKKASEWYLVAELWAKQFWVFLIKIYIMNFFRKHPKLFCLYLSNHISHRGCFVVKTNGRISSITLYKDHCCGFFMSWVIKEQRKLYFENVEKTPNFGRVVHTQIRVRLFIFC